MYISNVSVNVDWSMKKYTEVTKRGKYGIILTSHDREIRISNWQLAFLQLWTFSDPIMLTVSDFV